MSREYHHDELPADLREQLCAWMDGELPADQAAFLQRRLAHDPALRALWERWQLASACLRGQPLRLMPDGLGERLQVHVQAAAPRRRHWPWAAGLAAAVLLAVLLPRMTGLETPPGLPEPPLLAAETGPLGPLPAAGPMSGAGAEPAARPWPRSPLAPGADEMEAYLVRHNALLGDQGLGGFMPYVDVVVHEPEPSAGAGDPGDPDGAADPEERRR
ncbi:MAG TPA: sigma-E factor negative regulatory protein [Arenimonas sp.]|nr:sigma-E factor negative regulatory protein [Arenimonas sp.]